MHSGHVSMTRHPRPGRDVNYWVCQGRCCRSPGQARSAQEQVNCKYAGLEADEVPGPCCPWMDSKQTDCQLVEDQLTWPGHVKRALVIRDPVDVQPGEVIEKRLVGRRDDSDVDRTRD